MTSRGTPATARERAAEALIVSYDGQSFCRPFLSEWQEASPLDPRDAAFAVELATGTARQRLICEHLASRFHHGRWAGVPIRQRVALALGIYQLCWLQIADHAAIDSSVDLAKRQGPRAAGTINAILRAIAAARGPLILRPDEADRRRFMTTDPGRGRLFSEDVFPDPARRPLDWLVAATGHPMWLIERWHRRFKPKRCLEICRADQRRADTVLRPNPLRTTPTELCERLRAQEFPARMVVDSPAIIVHGSINLALCEEFRDGLFQPQGAAAQIALRLSPPQSGEFLLDLCAGVGTKSTQAAEMMADRGLVLASDPAVHQLQRIAENAARLGLSIVRTTPPDGVDAAVRDAGRAPDVILVDAPCTNTGVLARRPEARFRASHKALLEMVEIQRGILDRANQLAGPATRLIYSTCSLESEENEEQAAWFIKQYPNWRIEKESFTTPDCHGDGGYAAVLVRGQVA